MKYIFLSFMLTISAWATTPKTINLSDSNTVIFRSAFTPEYVAEKQIEILTKSVTSSTINLVLDTPGGDVGSGALFIDTINGLGINVNTITIFAASMGYITAQNLSGKRYILPSGTLMSHRAKIGGIDGQLPGESNTRLKFYQDFVERLSKGAANRVGISYKKYMSQIQDELWLVGDKAVKAGHADEVVLIKCDASLRGTEDIIVKTMLGSFNVTYSKCPLINAPLKYELVGGIKGVVPKGAVEQIYKSKRSQITMGWE
jgi:ATP-dependent protease ClpP protease subunit